MYYGRAALNLIWQNDRESQDNIKQSNPSLIKIQINKFVIGREDNLKNIGFKTNNLRKKFEEVR